MNCLIPKINSKIAIVDGRIQDDIKRSLESFGLNVIKTCKCSEVYDSISYHPDIVIHPIDYNTLIIAPNVFDYYEKRLKNKGFKLIKGSKHLGNIYPENIAYNVGRIGNLAIHNTKYTDRKLKNYLYSLGIKLIDVNQGYTKCSLGLIDENTGITSDKIIYGKLKNQGYKMLLIEPGYINLVGQKYGFIGGCMGNLSNETVLFSGKLSNHPDEEKIINFIKNKNKNIEYLSKRDIEDIGSIFIL